MRWRMGLSSIMGLSTAKWSRILTACRRGARISVAMLADSPTREMAMRRFKVGDHVAWNSEAGRVSGRIVKIHTRDFDYKGHVHHASPDKPQYEIRSDKTDHVAAHYGQVLAKLDD